MVLWWACQIRFAFEQVNVMYETQMKVKTINWISVYKLSEIDQQPD